MLSSSNQSSNVTASGNLTSLAAAVTLQALSTNGATYDLRNYVPAAVTGYSNFVRVINTSTGTVTLTVARIDPATGVVGTAGTVGTIVGRGATTFTPAQIETAAGGAFTSTDRPRLRFTATGGTLQVQSMLAQPNGTITDANGAQ